MKNNITFTSIREFIHFLEEQGSLYTINEPVNTQLEITAIAQEFIEKGNTPALLFNNVYLESGEKSAIPVITNLYANRKHILWGLAKTEENFHELGEMFAFLRHPTPPENLRDALKHWPLLKKITAMGVKEVKKAPAQEIVYTGDTIDISKFPIQGCWPNEPAPLITWPLVITEGENKTTNIGIYRMQVISKTQTLMRWLEHRGGAQHFHQFKKKNPGKPMPVAIALGADPHLTLSAVMPLPENMSEYKFAGLIRGKKTEVVRAKTQPLLVPAHAEIIIEGHIDPTEVRPEGPYGDHTGYYNSIEEFPLMTITAITTRKDPIYLTTHTGRPPDEPSILGETYNEICTPLLKKQFPEVQDFYLPKEACSYRMAIISINKTYAGQARKVMMGLWSFLPQFLYTKFIIVVDNDINARDWKDIVWRISTHVEPSRDIMMIENTPIDYLDFASALSGLGSKIGIDATKKIGVETTRPWGIKMETTPAMQKKAKEIWDGFMKAKGHT